MRRRCLPPKPEPPPEGFVLRADKQNNLREFRIGAVEAYSAMALANAREPDWRNDPTYNLRRKK